MKAFKKRLADELQFMAYAPSIFISVGGSAVRSSERIRSEDGTPSGT